MARNERSLKIYCAFVIETLVTGTGEFDESEVWSYGNATLELVAALIEARPEGRYSDEEWRDVTAR
jgi:hypothetical protein